MTKNYHSKLEDKPYINKHGQRDVLVGMARAGTNLAKYLAKHPQLTRASAEVMAGDSPIQNLCNPYEDLSQDLKELKRLQRQYEKSHSSRKYSSKK